LGFERATGVRGMIIERSRAVSHARSTGMLQAPVRLRHRLPAVQPGAPWNPMGVLGILGIIGKLCDEKCDGVRGGRVYTARRPNA